MTTKKNVFFSVAVLYRLVSSKFFEESSVKALSALDKLKEASMDVSNVQDILRCTCIPRWNVLASLRWNLFASFAKLIYRFCCIPTSFEKKVTPSSPSLSVGTSWLNDLYLKFNPFRPRLILNLQEGWTYIHGTYNRVSVYYCRLESGSLLYQFSATFQTNHVLGAGQESSGSSKLKV